VGLLAVRAALLLICTSAAWARPNTPGSTDLFHYAPGDIVESFDATNFRIWFTRAGANAVGSDDANLNGTPDDVEEVAQLYEQVLAFYKMRGFRVPPSDANLPGDNGGDGRFDVYLLDFGGKSDGAFQQDSCTKNVCTGYSVHENDFAGYGYPSRNYGNRVLASHEFFHAVQAAYDTSEDVIISEGTAVWATEQFDNTLNDFEGFVSGYLSRTDHSLDVPMTGPVDAFSYGTCIFFEFLSEKYGDAIIRELWESAAGPNDWFSVLDGVLQAHQSSFADAFATFATWNLFTGKRANPSRGYARGSGYTLVTFEADTAPLTIQSLRVFPSAIAYLAIPPQGRTHMNVGLVGAGADIKLALATRTGNVISAPSFADDANAGTDVDTSTADDLIVVVANTAQSGESQKPGLCAGDAAERDACKAQLAPPPPPSMTNGCDIGGAGGFRWWMLLLGAGACLRSKRRWHPKSPPPR
jgi:hypothetical protein